MACSPSRSKNCALPIFDGDDIEGVARTFDTPEWAIRAVFVLIGWWAKDALDVLEAQALQRGAGEAALRRLQATPAPTAPERRSRQATPPPAPPVTHRPSEHAFIAQTDQALGIGGAVNNEVELDNVLEHLADGAYRSVASGIDLITEPLRSLANLFKERLSQDMCYAEQIAEQYADVLVVSLGHTHRALTRSFQAHHRTAQYVNSGTWMPTFHLQWNTRPAELFDVERYVSDYDFVEVSWDAWSDEPQAQLKQWSAALRLSPLERV